MNDGRVLPVEVSVLYFLVAWLDVNYCLRVVWAPPTSFACVLLVRHLLCTPSVPCGVLNVLSRFFSRRLCALSPLFLCFVTIFYIPSAV